MKLRQLFLSAAAILLTHNAFAALHLELTQGMSGSLPIAVVPFGNDPNSINSPYNLGQVIQNDLQNSGRFKVLPGNQITQFPTSSDGLNYNFWKGTGSDDVVVGNVKSIGGGKYQVSFALLDVYKGINQPGSAVVTNDQFTISADQFRVLAHKISDEIYQALTGDKGVFSTKIAYILVEPGKSGDKKYMLEVADQDGYNPRPILISSQPIMSPTWSPDGRHIAYVSFENQRSAIYISDISSGSRQLVSDLPGINGAPAFSPDGKKLALALSKDTPNLNIYVMDIATRSLKQVTNNEALNTEPNWSPDGKSIIFTSNSGGGPQIYRLSLDSANIQRVTFDGNYNATGSFTPDGKDIVVLHGAGNNYNIAMQDLSSGSLSLLTRSGNDASPSLAPNGKMIIYANQDGQQGVLGMVSTDGSIKLRIPAPEGSVREAAWSPFLG